MIDTLRARYAELAHRLRMLGKEPPALPDTEEPNTIAGINRTMVGMLNGREETHCVTMQKKPVIFPLKDDGERS